MSDIWHALEVYIMRELLCLPQSLSLSLSLCLSDLYNIHEQIKSVTIVLSAGRYAVESSQERAAVFAYLWALSNGL